MKISAAWKNLIENASLNSILGGGMSVPQISLHKYEEHIEVSIRVPGMDSQDLFVEIQGEKVVVFRILELMDKDGSEKSERFIVHWFPITKEIDYKNIHAFQKDSVLRIILPLEEHYDDFSGGRRLDEN